MYIIVAIIIINLTIKLYLSFLFFHSAWLLIIICLLVEHYKFMYLGGIKTYTPIFHKPLKLIV